MNQTMTQTATTKPEVFWVWSDEVLKNRIDAYFYQPKFKELYKVLEGGKYKVGKLSDLFDGELIKGILPTHEEKGDEVNVIQISNVDRDGVIDTSDCLTAKREAYEDKHILRRNDILVVITGATIGKVGFWKDEKDNFYLGGDIVKFQVKKEFDPIFVWAYLRSKFGQKQILRHITGATNKHLSPDDVASIQIPILPLEKQKKVSVIVQSAYAEKRKKEEEAQQVLASIDGFVLGELGIDIAGGHERERERERVSEAAPETYVIWSDEIKQRIDPNFYRPYFKELLRAIHAKNNLTLGEIVEFSNEIWDQKSIFEDNFPYIEISGIDLKTGDIEEIAQLLTTDAPSRAKMVVRHNDIIVSTTRPNRGAITKISEEQDGSIASTGFAVLRDLKTDKISRDYLFVMLRSILSLKQMEQRTTGGNYPAITAEDLKQIRIVVPDRVKQEKITSGVQSSYAKMRTLRAQAAEVLENAQKQVEQMILE